jgi:hypothetical protein
VSESKAGLFEEVVSVCVVRPEITTERHVNPRRINPIDTPIENILLTSELVSRRAATVGEIIIFGLESGDSTNQRYQHKPIVGFQATKEFPSRVESKTSREGSEKKHNHRGGGDGALLG